MQISKLSACWSNTSLKIITNKLGKWWNLMQLTEAIYHFAIAIAYQGQEITWEKLNGILIVCRHFNTIIFSVIGNTYTLIASKNNLEGGCCKLKREIICESSYRDRNALRLQISYFVSIYYHIICKTTHAPYGTITDKTVGKLLSCTDDYIGTWKIVAWYWHRWQDRQHICVNLSAGVKTTCAFGLATIPRIVPLARLPKL